MNDETQVVCRNDLKKSHGTYKVLQAFAGIFNDINTTHSTKDYCGRLETTFGGTTTKSEIVG